MERAEEERERGLGKGREATNGVVEREEEEEEEVGVEQMKLHINSSRQLLLTIR